jgi:hypothetical protein
VTHGAARQNIRIVAEYSVFRTQPVGARKNEAAAIRHYRGSPAQDVHLRARSQIRIMAWPDSPIGGGVSPDKRQSDDRLSTLIQQNRCRIQIVAGPRFEVLRPLFDALDQLGEHGISRHDERQAKVSQIAVGRWLHA